MVALRQIVVYTQAYLRPMYEIRHRGDLLVVEYEQIAPILWVPQPLSFARLAERYGLDLG